MSIPESMELLSMQAETLDNLVGALQLAMPDKFHVEQMRQRLPEIRDALRRVYARETGDNPWESAACTPQEK
jgi:flagellar basal body-associated protein FliL